MKKVQTQMEWEAKMSEDILALVHSELYLDLRFLELAFCSLKLKSNPSLQTFATDGAFLFYSPQQILRVFPSNPKFLNRAMLHSFLHCIFSHLWLRGKRNQVLWNISCDIAVEYTIDSLEKNSTKRIMTWQRQKLYEELQNMDVGISAATIYRTLLAVSQEEVERLKIEFYTDDHRFWPAGQESAAAVLPQAQHWNQIARQISIQQEQMGKDRAGGQQIFDAQVKVQRSRRSYHDFLKKFTLLREELQLDPDEFDLTYYTYGLRIYDNLPLIEPLETKEVRKIREFVIVIDTSESTSGNLVTAFLKETFEILSQKNNFFKRCSLRILQCDTAVRSDLRIRNLDECDAVLKDFHIIGGGGTDFRPAFAYVNQLITGHEIQKLGGLLYFTDGKGIYPSQKPSYPAAFLFLEQFDGQQIPPWAMRLYLEPEEFLGKSNF